MIFFISSHPDGHVFRTIKNHLNNLGSGSLKDPVCRIIFKLVQKCLIRKCIYVRLWSTGSPIYICEGLALPPLPYPWRRSFIRIRIIWTISGRESPKNKRNYFQRGFVVLEKRSLWSPPPPPWIEKTGHVHWRSCVWRFRSIWTFLEKSHPRTICANQIDFDKIFSKFSLHMHWKKWTHHLAAMF